ncbi:hypothetical protein WR25_25179 [Diploscapter pachys]|uniref:Uncharacterized protein n=1 Tax=Diploscapter pachys TaxID=2018661 RepID=A0A2A2JA94_9BILA|nr:hypothetical protein WR25_25179 [Diploscapter pachys]
MPRPRKARPNILEVRRREASEESSSSNDNYDELASADDGGVVVDDVVQPVIRDDSMNEENSDDDMSLTCSRSTANRNESECSSDCSEADPDDDHSDIDVKSLDEKSLIVLSNILIDRLSNRGAKRALFVLDDGEAVRRLLRASSQISQMVCVCHICGRMNCRNLSTDMSQFIRKRPTQGPKLSEPKQKSSRLSTEKLSIGPESDRSSTSAFPTPSPSPVPAIQQILGVGNSAADELNENLIEDNSGYEPSPHAARLLKSLKKEEVTRITKNKRKKAKSGEMKMADPVKLAKEFLFTVSGQRVSYASVMDNVDDYLRQRLPIDIDAIAVLAEKARNPETAEMFLALAGVCMILNREFKRIENRTKERTDKARPKETEFYTAQVVDESAIKALGPLSTPIHTCSSDEADIAPAALSKGLPNSIAMTDIISKITQNVLHTVLRPYQDSPFLTASTTNNKYIPLHHDFFQSITEVITTATHLEEHVSDPTDQGKHRRLIVDSVRRQTSNFLDHLRQDYFRLHSKEETAGMINAIKERYKQEMEGRQIDGSADYGEGKSPTYDDDSPFEI